MCPAALLRSGRVVHQLRLEALEASEDVLTPEKRLAVVRRAMAALREAVELADQLRAEGSAAGRN